MRVTPRAPSQYAQQFALLVVGSPRRELYPTVRSLRTTRARGRLTMARLRNAFKIRAADAPIIETAQFLQLYCPLLLDQLQRDDLFVPKLIVVRGSPGLGKSSLLRLFEAETLLAVHARRSQPSDQDLVERLTELGILADSG